MNTRRSTTALALTACCAVTVAAPAPALAADGPNDVAVSLSATGGTRQFDVLQTGTTQPLSSLDLGSTGSRSFRTRVRDEHFETLTRGYDVTATMSNLYLVHGDGSHDPAVKVPSSQLSVSAGGLRADALAVSLLPRLSVEGTLASCPALPDAVKTSLGIPLGAGLPALLTGLHGPLLALCTALGATGAPVAGTVDGALQQVTTAVADVAELPNALTAGAGRAFDDADYAHDRVAALDPDRAGAPAATGVDVMSGAAAGTLPAELVTALRTELTAALAGVPLVSATDTGAATTVSRALGTVTDTAVRRAVAGLTSAQQAELLRTLPVTLLDPVLASVKGVTTAYYATSTLSAVRNAPVPGVYDGTLTLTFVQR